MPRIVDTIEQLIGKTPMLVLNHFSEKNDCKARLVAKLEYLNPAGSAKDRAAKYMIDDAEKNGFLKPGATIIEPTSGNTGIGLALVAAARGYRLILTMPDSMSAERRAMLRAYGAELVLTPGALGMQGAVQKANELAEEHPGSFIPDQFANHSNARAHYETTGPEIWNACQQTVDIFVAGVGTGGTITGVGRYLKEQDPSIQIVAVEPERSPILSGGVAGPHGIQGIGANFIPSLLDRSVIDQVITVSDEEAFSTGRHIVQEEGIFVGISSGAALSAGVQLAKQPENTGKTIVCFLPDSGDRYLSSPMFQTD